MSMSALPRGTCYVLLAVSSLCFSINAEAGWRDLLKSISGGDEETSTPVTGAEMLGGLSNSEMIEGLKEALAKGTRSAVNMLGKPDGYLGNAAVKIPMPEALQKVEKGLRKIGKEDVADEFVETMNRAAEKAVPEAASIFADAVKDMSIADAKNILQGEDDAATRYFRENSEASLKEKFLPIVKTATGETGVTASYKKMTGKLGMLSSFIDTDKLDLDNYVTDKALDGLFLMVAAEEKKIRDNPLERSSDLLKKVFSSLGK